MIQLDQGVSQPHPTDYVQYIYWIDFYERISDVFNCIQIKWRALNLMLVDIKSFRVNEDDDFSVALY